MSKRALISVTDKSGVVEFARELNNLGYEVYLLVIHLRY